MRERYAFWSYAAGAGAARTGDEMSGTALLLAGLAATGSAATGSALLAGLTAAAAVGGPVVGVLLDRSTRPGRLLALALACYAAALAAVLASLGRLPAGVSVLVAAAAGLFGPALSGGWTAQLPRLVRRERLAGASALDAMTFDAASLAGPALAGAVAAVWGAPAGVLAAVALIGLALPSALALPPAAGRPAARVSVAADVAAGFRAVVRTRPLARATTTSVISCAGQGLLVACAPLLGERALGSAGGGAALLSCVAAAALAANALLARLPWATRPDDVVRYSPLVLAAALLLASTGRPAPVIAAMLLAGLGEGPQLSALFAVRHREAPAHLRAQIFTTGASLKISAFALGAASAAPLAAHSLRTALLTSTATQLLASTAPALLRGTRPTQRARNPRHAA